LDFFLNSISWALEDESLISIRSKDDESGKVELSQNEGIVITGIDANPQARDAIAAGGNFEASVAQDFKGIGATAADTMARVLGGEVLKANVIYVPTQLVTSVNAK
jgi:ribose transport system substrate-binding protein